MNVINSVKDYVTTVFELSTSLTEAIDIVAIQRDAPSRQIRTTPFYVRFERTKYHENRVEIIANGVQVPDVYMELDSNGEAYFVHPSEPTPERAPTTTMEDMFFTDTFDPPSASQSPHPLDSVNTTIHVDHPPPTPLNAGLRVPSVYFDAIPNPSPEKAYLLKKNTSDYFDAESEASTASPALSHSDATSSMSPHQFVLDTLPFDSTPRLSLCGHAIHSAMSPADAHAAFVQHQVTADAFRANPTAILQDAALMISIHGALHRYDLVMQAFFLSKVCFPAPLSVNTAAPIDDESVGDSDASPSHVPLERRKDSTDQDVGPRIHRAGSDPTHKTNGADSDYSSKWLKWFRSTSSWSHTKTAPQSTTHAAGRLRDSFLEKPRVFFPSDAQLDRMGLHFGENQLEFRVKSTVFGEDDRSVAATLYLWHASTKLVLADVEATMSLGGEKPTASFLRSSIKVVLDGAADFYTHLVANGYQILYLSTRRHADVRDVIDYLPHGPLLAAFSPAGDQMQLKLSMLQQIQALYPVDVNPFYAALTDDAHAAVFLDSGLHPGKLLVMDAKTGGFSLAHQKVLKQKDQHQSFAALRDNRLLDAMFPPIYSVVDSAKQRKLSISCPPPTTSAASDTPDSPSSALMGARRESRTLGEEAFNDLNFWRLPPPSLH
ncbi:Aste57867_21919 [Aphanomyces stellatus]|uniref:phosphatidate phosphatase n=1 Tax=Aphanomyces stellatus TaxID=120398 RepID=A0A485LIU9_9STRA|nr:hypothetical protein As57867_021850 [Aphanomyces stellatus]VFT98587.1 Aste57867_21919 [Aphanomyces stellatus]